MLEIEDDDIKLEVAQEGQAVETVNDLRQIDNAGEALWDEIVDLMDIDEVDDDISGQLVIDQEVAKPAKPISIAGTLPITEASACEDAPIYHSLDTRDDNVELGLHISNDSLYFLINLISYTLYLWSPYCIL